MQEVDFKSILMAAINSAEEEQRLLHSLKDVVIEINSIKAHQQYMDEMINHLHKENAKLKFLLEDVITEIGRDANKPKD